LLTPVEDLQYWALGFRYIPWLLGNFDSTFSHTSDILYLTYEKKFKGSSDYTSVGDEWDDLDF